jgi:3'(2'), 5'-bisphosphate nucleotidase
MVTARSSRVPESVTSFADSWEEQERFLERFVAEFSIGGPAAREAADLGRRLAEIALEAAAVIRPYWRAGGAVSVKADASPVTEADHAGEAVILERLRRDFPGVFVVAEEQVSQQGLPAAVPARFFLVDALDGTRGFTSGSENFTVNIALVEDGAPVAGAVAAPVDGRVWFTTAEGARLRTADGEARAIAVRRAGADPLALVSCSLREADARRLGETHGFRAWRGVESSLKFCLLAQGEADLYPRNGPTSEWDTAAGQAVLEAAGGRVVTLEGEPLRYGKAEAAFVNPPFLARGG